MHDTFEQLGLALTASSRDQMDKRIRAALMKDDSIANQLDLAFTDQGHPKAIKIKLEIDVKSPPFSGEATTFLDFRNAGHNLARVTSQRQSTLIYPSDFGPRHGELLLPFETIPAVGAWRLSNSSCARVGGINWRACYA